MSASPIEKNKLENVDLLQIEYFSDLSISKKDIVVIEPSNPIALTIRKFLIDLGFENIYVCKEPDEGIEIFTDFIGNDISIPFIIDDNLPNQNLKKIIEEVLEIQPSAKILIITAKEKTDTRITELFDMGISAITPKPLDSIRLKESLTRIFENKDNEQSEIKQEKLESLLTSHRTISENIIKNMPDVDKLEVEAWLKKANEDQKIVLDKEILEAVCNQCKSSNIAHSSKCPSCKQINIKQEILIEHYSCGEVYVKQPGVDICPKCNKSIGSLGKGYLENADFYECKSCNDKFPKPFLELICLECGNIFVEEAIEWKKGKIYRVKK